MTTDDEQGSHARDFTVDNTSLLNRLAAALERPTMSRLDVEEA